MIQTAFISDLHLHPQCLEIHQRFERFIEWAKVNTKSVYILGDFIHVWAGDDLMDDYAHRIIALLNQLNQAGIAVYFMPGNRDFLIGNEFIKQANLHVLNDPTIVTLDGYRIFLTHGDRYCTSDRAHQFLRFWTRNFWFKSLFIKLPKFLRKSLVESVRNYSQSKKKKPVFFPINEKKLFKDMHRHQVFVSVYGHIHQWGHHQDIYKHFNYQRFILSDWDKNPQILCYNKHKGLFFNELD
jgi:UDP-2,3-diacylglucosamine hydrolase